jgi:hypothetical protein
MAARRTTVTRESKTVRSRQVTTPAGGTIETGEAKPGMGYADALVIATTILLIAAFILMDKYIGRFGPDSGSLFFKT